MLFSKKRSSRRMGAVTIFALVVMSLFYISLTSKANGAAAPEIGSADNAANTMVILHNQSVAHGTTIEAVKNKRGFFENLNFGVTNSYYMSAKISASYSSYLSDVRLIIGQLPDGETIEVGMRPCNAYSSGFDTADWQAVVWKVSEEGQEGAPVNGCVAGGLPAPKNAVMEENTGDASYDCTVCYEDGRISFWVDGVQIFDAADLSDSIRGIALKPGFHAYEAEEAVLSDIKIWGDVKAASVADHMIIRNSGRDETASYHKNKSLPVEAYTRGTFENLVYGDAKEYWLSADISGTYVAEQSDIRLILGQLPDGSMIEAGMRPCPAYSETFNEDNWQVVVWKSEDAYNHGDVVNGMVYAPPAPSGARKDGDACEANYNCTIHYENGRITLWIDGSRVIDGADSGTEQMGMRLQLGFHAYQVTGTISNIIIWGDVTAKAVKDSTLLGDCNGDDEVNVQDLIRLKRYMAGKAEVNNQGNIKAEEVTNIDNEDMNALRKIILNPYNDGLAPIWQGELIYDEAVMPLANEDGTIDAIPLLYHADEIISVRSSDLQTVYVEGKDYKLTEGCLEIIETGNIPITSYDEYYLKDGEMVCTKEGYYLRWSEDGDFHKRQIAVTYVHSDNFEDIAPEKKGDKLPHVNEKLQNKEELNIVFYGDSVTAGASASGTINERGIAPYLRRWSELVVDNLKRTYGYESIHHINTAVGGQTSEWGAANVQDQVVAYHPDLLVLGFGMNDGTQEIATDIYGQNIRHIIDAVRAANPDCDIILVSTMMPNPEAKDFNKGQKEYLPVLKSIEAEYDNVAIADMTTMHQQLLTRKSFRDMTGNNINHPNDFLIRIYGQLIMETLSCKQ